MKGILSVLLLVLSMAPLLAHAEKPRSPLQLNIYTAEPGLAPVGIKPGDVVELKIVGKAVTDTDKLRIDVKLQGGVELVSGDTSWTGPASKGAEKVLLITVRAPLHGHGTVSARLSMSPSKDSVFSASAEYHLGKSVVEKPGHQPAATKDRKGRKIKEYRVN
jgi:hypothetical protein